jgi:hypothetical protein
MQRRGCPASYTWRKPLTVLGGDACHSFWHQWWSRFGDGSSIGGLLSGLNQSRQRGLRGNNREKFPVTTGGLHGSVLGERRRLGLGFALERRHALGGRYLVSADGRISPGGGVSCELDLLGDCIAGTCWHANRAGRPRMHLRKQLSSGLQRQGISEEIQLPCWPSRNLLTTSKKDGPRKHTQTHTTADIQLQWPPRHT